MKPCAIITSLCTAAILSCSIPSIASGTPSIFSNFTGVNSTTVGAINGFTLEPPDTMGAMGLNNQYAEFINGAYALYNVSAPAAVTQTSLITDAQFWVNAGVSSATLTNGISDPRILFDVNSNHWFASEITTDNNSNKFLVAVSKTADITQGFTGAAYSSNTGTNNFFADFDMLGVNGDGVYVGATSFTSTTGAGNGSIILALSKSALLANTAVPNKVFYFPTNAVGDLPHPVTDMDAPGSTGNAYFLSDDASSTNRSDLSTLTGPGSNPSGLTLTTSGANVILTGDATPPGAVQKGSSTTIDAGDDRYSGVVVKKNGFLWGVQGTSVGGRDALHWEQINISTHAIVHDGFITDPSLSFYYGSIAVNSNGDIVIGYTGSGASQYASTYASVGSLTGSGVTFGAPILLHAGTAAYAGSRWGDYSNTVVDPSDSTKFWTVQEFSSGGSVWSTQITGIIVPAPEPSPVFALGVGIVLLGLRAVRRRGTAAVA